MCSIPRHTGLFKITDILAVLMESYSYIHSTITSFYLSILRLRFLFMWGCHLCKRMTYIQLYEWIIVNGEPQVLSEMADAVHKCCFS